MFWTVRVGDSVGFYTGGFNTTLVWYFDLETCNWNLSQNFNLDNAKACQGCEGAHAYPRHPRSQHPRLAPPPFPARPTPPAKCQGQGGGEEVEEDEFMSVSMEVAMFDHEQRVVAGRLLGRELVHL